MVGRERCGEGRSAWGLSPLAEHSRKSGSMTMPIVTLHTIEPDEAHSRAEVV
jgi:hypothetical protein